MLRWCAYCQEFKGEVAPFEDLSHTHGICPSCQNKGPSSIESQIEYGKRLQKIKDLLMKAGKEDLRGAEEVVQAAMAVGMRPVDILLGLVTPCLYTIGEGWRQGTVTVSEQRHFSFFCDKVFDLVGLRVELPVVPGPGAQVLLVNTYGNRHTLGIRILNLWLKSQGINTLILDREPSPKQLIQTIQQVRPNLIIISIALADHQDGLRDMVDLIRLTPLDYVPKVIVGGNAVRSDSIAPIPGVTFVTDITQLERHYVQPPDVEAARSC